MARVIIFYLGILLCSFSLKAETEMIARIAVGPDHNNMLSRQYPFYTASWHFLVEMLKRQNINVQPYSMPWARAKSKVLSGELDGLFLAANFEGRENWAMLSEPIGYDYFGHFAKANSELPHEVIGMVRVGKHDQVHQDVANTKTIEVATAQVGLSLLAQDKISKFVMSQGYGNYLLSHELKQHADEIFFLSKNAERRSLHVAVSKNHPKLAQLTSLFNNAINSGISQGTYHQIMQKFKVPCANQLNCK